MLWFLGSALLLIIIYLYTKFNSNANSSFIVIAGQSTGTNGLADDYMLPLFGEHKNKICISTQGKVLLSYISFI